MSLFQLQSLKIYKIDGLRGASAGRVFFLDPQRNEAQVNFKFARCSKRHDLARVLPLLKFSSFAINVKTGVKKKVAQSKNRI